MILKFLNEHNKAADSMKMYYVANIRLPTEKAHGIQIMKMCEAFAMSGVTVTLVVPKRINAIRTTPFAYYRIPEGIFSIIRVPVIDFIIFDALLGKLAFWLERTVFALSASYVLWRRKGAYDYVYTRDFYLAKRLLRFGIPVVVEAHEFPQYPALYASSWKKLHRIIVLTRFLRDKFVAHGISEKRVMIAPDGVDAAAFRVAVPEDEARRTLMIPHDKRIVLYTGHLYAWKGADVLARAAVHLPEYVLVIIVGGTAKDIAAFRQTYGHMRNVLICGHVPHEQIPLWLRAADVLVLPNSAKARISREYTSPLKLFEYMAAGKPIVAADVPSLREILHASNSLLVTPDDPERLAEGIMRLLHDERFAKKIAATAQREVRSYTWSHRAERIANFL